MKSPENTNNEAGAVVRERLVRRLVEARENLRWTQADLAKATGLQPAAISHFECGQRLPALPNAVRLADALRISLDWLTGRNDDVPETASLRGDRRSGLLSSAEQFKTLCKN